MTKDIQLPKGYSVVSYAEYSADMASRVGYAAAVTIFDGVQVLKRGRGNDYDEALRDAISQVEQ